MKTYKIDFFSHLKNGWLIIFLTCFCLASPSFLSWVHPNQRDETSRFIGIIVFMILVLPAIIVHLNYYLVNKGDVLKCDEEHNEITIRHKGLTTTFNVDDIDYVIQSISTNEFENRVGIVPWESYSHYVIYLKGGKIFTLTSLLVPRLNVPLDKEKILTKQNLYRLAIIR